MDTTVSGYGTTVPVKVFLCPLIKNISMLVKSLFHKGRDSATLWMPQVPRSGECDHGWQLDTEVPGHWKTGLGWVCSRALALAKGDKVFQDHSPAGYNSALDGLASAATEAGVLLASGH